MNNINMREREREILRSGKTKSAVEYEKKSNKT